MEMDDNECIKKYFLNIDTFVSNFTKNFESLKKTLNKYFTTLSLPLSQIILSSHSH